MSYIIAVAGKGGGGKTSLTVLLIKELLRRKQGPVLAVDADPNANLGEVLGVEAKTTIGSICDQALGSMSQVPQGMSNGEFLEYHIQSAVIEAGGFDLLSMGRPEGAGCYCYVNNLVRKLVDKLIKNYPLVVLDNEAGLEHLSRRTTRQADLLLLISDSSLRGLKAVSRVVELVKELKLDIRDYGLIVNRSIGELSPRFMDHVDEQGLKLWGIVPHDDTIARLDAEGIPLMRLPAEAPAAQVVSRLADKLLLEKSEAHS